MRGDERGQVEGVRPQLVGGIVVAIVVSYVAIGSMGKFAADVDSSDVAESCMGIYCGGPLFTSPVAPLITVLMGILTIAGLLRLIQVTNRRRGDDR